MTITKFPWIFLTILGALLAAGSIWWINRGDEVLGYADRMVITTPEGEKLVGYFYLGNQPAGILLLEGFGSDQVTMKSAAVEFAHLGVNVFTFDFSGHGRSPGGLGFDNAETDRLAKQVLAVKNHFAGVANLQSDQIILLGHSLGARVALQAAAMDPTPPVGLILLGTQVNLSTNVQSEFFTGVSDIDLAWVQNLGPENPRTKILMISRDWDDILTPDAAELLIQKLGGENLWSRVVGTTLGKEYSREMVILPNLYHNYEPFSPRLLSIAKMWAGQVWELSGQYSVLSFTAGQRVILWVIGFAGILLGVVAAGRWVESAPNESGSRSGGVKILNLKRFLWGKLLLWVAAIPFMILVMGAVFLIPLNKPIFNLIYVGFIGGYGLLLWGLYHWGRMPGVTGRLPYVGVREQGSGMFWAALGTGVLLMVVTTAFARTGWFYGFPFNERLLWLVIFTPVTALGFWIGLQEMEMLKDTGIGNWITRLLVSIIGWVPFFVYTGLMAGIGSVSGLVSGLQGLLILCLVLASGTLIQQIGRRFWLTAFIQAVLLYGLILPQGVLFL